MRGENACRYSILARRSDKNSMKINPKKLEDAYRMYKAEMLIEHVCEVVGVSENIIRKYIKKKESKRGLSKRKRKV